MLQSRVSKPSGSHQSLASAQHTVGTHKYLCRDRGSFFAAPACPERRASATFPGKPRVASHRQHLAVVLDRRDGGSGAAGLQELWLGGGGDAEFMRGSELSCPRLPARRKVAWPSRKGPFPQMSESLAASPRLVSPLCTAQAEAAVPPARVWRGTS